MQNHKMVAIVGRPNVGKSALFNRLAGRQLAIVHDRPGVTRDRLVAQCRKGDAPFDIMDTGGIGEIIEDEFNRQVQAEANLAIEVADLILFVVDGMAGLTPVDQALAATLRKTQRPLILVVNKMDSARRLLHAAEFSALGFNRIVETSAAHGLGIDTLLSHIGSILKLEAQPPGEEEQPQPEESTPPIRLAVVGRPNAGKSSFINAILGEQRTIVSPVAGTTRDAIDVPCEINGRRYVLVDTAGLRRKAKIHDAVETFSAQQATKSIRRADVCLLMVDASEMTMQDRKIAQLIVEERKPCVILLNKFDLFHPDARMKVRKEELLEQAGREFFFLRHAAMVPMSVKEGQFLKKAFECVEEVIRSANSRPGTGVLNRLLHRAVASSPQIAGSSGRMFNLLYATFRKEDEPIAVPPPEIILFANRADKLQESYLRHLESVIREEWPATGLPFTWTIRGKKREAEPGGPASPRRRSAPARKGGKGAPDLHPRRAK